MPPLIPFACQQRRNERQSVWASTDDGNRIRLLLAVNSILALLRWHRGEPKIKKKKKGGDKREDVGGRGRKKKWKEQRKEEEQRRGGVRGKRKKFAKRDKLCQCWMSVWVELVNEQTLEFFSASTASANQRTNSSLSLRRERRHTHATYTHTHTHTRTHTHTHTYTHTFSSPLGPRRSGRCRERRRRQERVLLRRLFDLFEKGLGKEHCGAPSENSTLDMY